MTTARRTLGIVAAALCALASLALASPSALAQMDPGRAEMLYEEQETAADEESANDEQQDGELIVGFGTGPGDTAYAQIIGVLAEPALAPTGGESTEEDGSIGLANVVELGDGPTLFDGVIGDSQYASTGDYDHYALQLSAGMTIRAWTDTTGLDDAVDSVIRIYDPEGELVVVNDDASMIDDEADIADLESIDSFVEYVAEDSGVFSIAVAGCCLPQVDPKRAGSGAGPGSTGDYQLVLETTFSSSDGGPGRTIVPDEDDGSIDLATQLDVGAGGTAAVESVIGDGPHAETTGDIDFYSVGMVEAETIITVEFESDLDEDDGLRIVAWDADGFFNSLFFVEEGVFVALMPTAGEAFFSVSACCEIPEDPFDPESLGEPNSIAANYRLEVSTAPLESLSEEAAEQDVDFYLVDLEVGDVLSAGFAGGVDAVEIYDPVGVLRMGSSFNASVLYPKTSPLRHQGSVGADHVAGQSGLHGVAVSGEPGGYRGELRVAKASTEPQTIFLDFDGETLDRGTFPDQSGDFTVSPFGSFLFRWDLGPQDRDETIAEVVATVEDKLEMVGGVETDIVILNSLDDPDPGYVSGVTRIVIGGSQIESSIETIGIAETIDPGNLDRDEVALVLLDSLSLGRRSGGSLNDVELAEGTSVIDLVGAGVGNVVSHEIGHLIGIWHTDRSNKIDALMDSGGDLGQLLGVGADGVFGTDDDIDVGFVVDEFSEGFYGFEDVVTRARIGLGAFDPNEEIRSPEPERTPPGKEDVVDELPEDDDSSDGSDETVDQEGTESGSEDAEPSDSAEDDDSADEDESKDADDDVSPEATEPSPFPRR